MTSRRTANVRQRQITTLTDTRVALLLAEERYDIVTTMLAKAVAHRTEIERRQEDLLRCEMTLGMTLGKDETARKMEVGEAKLKLETAQQASATYLQKSIDTDSRPARLAGKGGEAEGEGGRERGGWRSVDKRDRRKGGGEEERVKAGRRGTLNAQHNHKYTPKNVIAL